MLRKILFLILTAGFALGTARAGDVYVVDLQNQPPLETIPAGDYSQNGVPGSTPLDATRVASGDILILDNTASANAIVSGPSLTVAGNATLSIITSTSSGNIGIQLERDGIKGSMTVGEAGNAGIVVLGDAAADKAISITGKKLDIVNGNITYANQPNSNITLSFEEFSFANGTFTMAGTRSFLTITGAAVIGGGDGTNAVFVAAGNGGARFTAGLEVTKGGIFTKDNSGANASVGLGNSGALRLTGGTIKNDYASDLIFQSKAVTVDGDEKSTIVTTGTGKIKFGNGSDTALTVRQDLDIIDASVGFKSYSQTGGAVLVDGGLMTITETASMRGAETSFAGAGMFAGGLNVTGGATVGGWSGGDTVITTGAGTAMVVDKSSYVNIAESSVRLGDANTEAAISGIIIVGAAGNTLDATAGGRVTLDANTTFRVADAYRTSVAAGQVVISASGLSSVRGFDQINAIDDHFLLGTFLLAQATTTGGGYNAGDIYISKATPGYALDGSDFDLVKDKIINRYGPIVDTPGFIENIYKSVSTAPPGHPLAPLLPDPAIVPGSGSSLEKSYQMNLTNFQAFASYGYAARDGSLAAMYTGYNNSGVAEVAITTSNALISRVQDHVRFNNAVRAGLRDKTCGGEDAVSTAFNSQFSNHFWVGGFGLFEDVDANSGLPGYRYESGGFITGYDYASGPLTVGGVFAYAKGDFYDKSALMHDSSISSYSVAAHATYNHESGFYATGTAGFTYSDNDINELRSNAAAASGTSWNHADYHNNTFNLGMEVGYDLRAGDSLTLTPSVGIRHIRTSVSSHDEHMARIVAGRIRDVEKNATYLPVRMDIGYLIPTGSDSCLKLTFGGGYTYNLNTDGIKGVFMPLGFSNAYAHQVLGRESDRHAYEVGMGVRFTTDRIDLGLNYDYTGSSNTRVHKVMGTAGFSF